MNVIIISLITVTCSLHGGVLVLTPVDEHERNQGKQTVEGRHLFRGAASRAQQRFPRSGTALSDSFKETLWDELPQEGDFLTRKRARRLAWGSSRRAVSRPGVQREAPAQIAPAGGADPPLRALPQELAAGIRFSTTDSSFPAHPELPIPARARARSARLGAARLDSVRLGSVRLGVARRP